MLIRDYKTFWASSIATDEFGRLPCRCAQPLGTSRTFPLLKTGDTLKERQVKGQIGLKGSMLTFWIISVQILGLQTNRLHIIVSNTQLRLSGVFTFCEIKQGDPISRCYLKIKSSFSLFCNWNFELEIQSVLFNRLFQKSQIINKRIFQNWLWTTLLC